MCKKRDSISSKIQDQLKGGEWAQSVKIFSLVNIWDPTDKSVSHKHQIGDYQVYKTISWTINLTNISRTLLHQNLLSTMVTFIANSFFNEEEKLSL